MRRTAARHLIWLCAPAALAFIPVLAGDPMTDQAGYASVLAVLGPLSAFATAIALVAATATLGHVASLPKRTRRAWITVAASAIIAYAPLALLQTAFAMGIWAWPVVGDDHHALVECIVRSLVLGSALLVMPGVAAAVIAAAALMLIAHRHGVDVLRGARRGGSDEDEPEEGKTQ